MVNILVQCKLLVLMVPIIISETVLKDNMCIFVYSCMFVRPNYRFVLFSFFSRIIDQRFEKVSYFVFGDFNFRLDAKAVVEVGLVFFCCRPYQVCFFFPVENLKVTLQSNVIIDIRLKQDYF